MSARLVNLDEYDYIGRDGQRYTGEAAFVLNHLDSAESALAPCMDVSWDNLALYGLLDRMLDMPATLAQWINPKER